MSKNNINNLEGYFFIKNNSNRNDSSNQGVLKIQLEIITSKPFEFINESINTKFEDHMKTLNISSQNIDLVQIPQYNFTSAELNYKNYNIPSYSNKDIINQRHQENMKNLDDLTNNIIVNIPKTNNETSYNLKEKIEDIKDQNQALIYPHQSQAIQESREKIEEKKIFPDPLNEANRFDKNSLNENINEKRIEEVKEALEKSSNSIIKESLISKPNIRNITANPKSKINLKSINEAELERIKKIMRSNLPKNQNNEKEANSSDSDD